MRDYHVIDKIEYTVDMLQDDYIVVDIQDDVVIIISYDGQTHPIGNWINFTGEDSNIQCSDYLGTIN